MPLSKARLPLLRSTWTFNKMAAVDIYRPYRMTPTSDEEMQKLWAQFHTPTDIKYSVFHETHSCSMKLRERSTTRDFTQNGQQRVPCSYILCTLMAERHPSSKCFTIQLLLFIVLWLYYKQRRSQWQRGRRRSALARMLILWVRIPTGCTDACPLEVLYVLSGRGLYDELITRPEESYRLCCAVCDVETPRMRRPWPALGSSAK
jgi:hypothetical protein